MHLFVFVDNKQIHKISSNKYHLQELCFPQFFLLSLSQRTKAAFHFKEVSRKIYSKE